MSMLLSLPRTVFFSVAIIAGAISLVAAGSTLAAFTDTDSDTGTVTAGNVEIDVFGDGSLLFDAGAAGCDAELAPGDSCTASVTVENVGNLSVTLTEPTHEVSTITGGEDNPACIAGNNFSTSVTALTDTTLDPNDTATFDVTVTLDADPDDGCQGATADVTVTVTATST